MAYLGGCYITSNNNASISLTPCILNADDFALVVSASPAAFAIIYIFTPARHFTLQFSSFSLQFLMIRLDDYFHALAVKPSLPLAIASQAWVIYFTPIISSLTHRTPAAWRKAGHFAFHRRYAWFQRAIL